MRISSTNGLNTIYRNLTSVCDEPSPGNIYEWPMWVISNNAIHKPTFKTTYNNKVTKINHIHFILQILIRQCFKQLCFIKNNLFIFRSNYN